MRIDSHQHFWEYDPVRDAWIDDSMQVIRRDFLPQDLKPILNDNHIDGCIAVQADQSEAETEFLLKLSKDKSFIKGVVGWVDLCADDVENRLQYFLKSDKFCGVRHIVQAEPEGFLLRKDFQNGIKKLSKFNLTYDVLVKHRQLPEVIAFVEKFPNQPFVLDHLGKPPIALKELNKWKKNIEVLAKFPNVHCKISGMVTEADWQHWKPSDFTAYLDVIFNAFGTDRIMYGSDWPVCLLAAKYDEQLSIVEAYLSKFSEEDKSKIMGDNAAKFYNL